MTIERCFLLLIVCWPGFFLNGQNLVSNPGFEAPRPCPITYNNKPVKEVVPGWFSRDAGTPDYYHRCSKGDVGVPENWVSIAEPVSGDAYLGFYVFRAKYKETLQAKLSESLVKDTTYLVGAWVSHGSASAYQIRMLNVSLEMSPVQFDVEWKPSRSIDFYRWRIMNPQQLGWKQVQFEYKAKGAEQFLLIGALEPAVQQTAIHWPWNKAYRDEPQLDHAAYYFLDDVYVKPKYVEVSEDIEASTEPTFTLILEDINFQLDRWDLSDTTRVLLVDWSQQIERTRVDHVVISGHTDDSGTTTYNQQLSLQRATSVKTFLTEQGWPPELVEVQAMGELQPFVPNDTPENRSRNRRVVIDVYEIERL